jgi:hypothetical protein
MKLKTLLPLLVLALTVAFVSCKKGPEKLIVKTWKVTDITPKGMVNDSLFQITKDALMKVDMNFKDNKYSMTSNGNTIETGTYSLKEGKLVLQTEKGLEMDAIVTKDKLTLDSPEFTISLIPK